MTYSYFCIGTSLANLVNVETYVPIPPTDLPERGGLPMALTGAVARRLHSGRLQRAGAPLGAWCFDIFQNGFTDLNTFEYAVFTDATTVSQQVYVITKDSQGHWSPFQVHIDRSYIQQSRALSVSGIPYRAIYSLFGGVLQSATKTSNYTVTTSDHYLIADTSGGAITLDLPALSGVNADVPYTVYKSSASNNLVFDPNSSELIDGASTKTVTSVGWYTIIKSGSQWVNI